MKWDLISLNNNKIYKYKGASKKMLLEQIDFAIKEGATEIRILKQEDKGFEFTLPKDQYKRL